MPIDNDVIRTSEGLRFYLILDEIYKLFHNNNTFGMGTKLNLVESDTLEIESTKYCGYFISFGIYD
jgi:hypothetical protein